MSQITSRFSSIRQGEEFLFRCGEVVKQVIGAKSKSALLREFAEFLEPDRVPSVSR